MSRIKWHRKIKINIWKILIYIGIMAIIAIAIPRGIYYYADDKSQWLGFLGSYLGGVIGAIGSVIAIYFTIQHEKLIREEAEEKELIPILTTNIKKLSKEDVCNWGYDSRGYVIIRGTRDAGDGIPASDEWKESIQKMDDQEFDLKYQVYAYTIKNERNNNACNIEFKMSDSGDEFKKSAMTIDGFSLGYMQKITLFLAFNFAQRKDSNVDFNLEFFYENSKHKKKYYQTEVLSFIRAENENRYYLLNDVKGMLTAPKEV